MVSFDFNQEGDDDPPPDDLSLDDLTRQEEENSIMFNSGQENKQKSYIITEEEDSFELSIYENVQEKTTEDKEAEPSEGKFKDYNPDADLLSSFLDYVFEADDPEIDPFIIEGDDDTIKIWSLFSRSLEEKRIISETKTYLKFCHYAS